MAGRGFEAAALGVLVLVLVYALVTAQAPPAKGKTIKPTKRRIDLIVKELQDNVTALWGKVDMLSQPVHVHLHGDSHLMDHPGHHHHHHNDSHPGHHHHHHNDSDDDDDDHHHDHDHHHHHHHDHPGSSNEHEEEEKQNIPGKRQGDEPRKERKSSKHGQKSGGHDDHDDDEKDSKHSRRMHNKGGGVHDDEDGDKNNKRKQNGQHGDDDDEGKKRDPHHHHHPHGGHHHHNSPHPCQSCKRHHQPHHHHRHEDEEQEEGQSHQGARGTHVHIHLHTGDMTETSPHKDVPPAPAKEYRYACCDVHPGRSAPDVKGTILLRQMPGEPLQMKVELSGFPVDLAKDEGVRYLRAMHAHDYGDVTDHCWRQGGHYNPHDVNHGGPAADIRHPGDFGNLVVAEDGTLKTSFNDSRASLFGHFSLLGRGLVFHEGADDLGLMDTEASRKSGNAGDRAACCAVLACAPTPGAWDP